MTTPPCLGIDLAQRSFSAALRLDPRRVLVREFDNTAPGFRKLRGWLHQHCAGPVRAAMESTSIFAEPLAGFLHAEGHQVYVLNPERVACYARSLGQRNKTDPADARIIAAFIAAQEPTPWQPPSPEQKTLRELTRARHQLVAQGRQLRQQLLTSGPAARPYLEQVLAALRQQISALEAQLKGHLRAHPLLGDQVRRLCTCKGIGLTTAAIVIAELPPLSARTQARALCAWAGLTPKRWQSGSSEGRTRLSRKGNAYLRHALYLPALVARRHNPLFRSFALRLSSRGKSSGAILGAVSHKLLRTLIGMLCSQSDFDPNWQPKST